MKYPIKIKASVAFIEELNACENGRYEDALAARESNDANDYKVVFGDFGTRWKTQIEVKTDAELIELYYVCAAGTIGVNGFTRTANRILDQIRDKVATLDPLLVKTWKRQSGN